MKTFNSIGVLKTFLTLSFLLMAVLLYACSDDPVSVEERQPAPEEEEVETVEQFGTVTGIVTAANGVTPIQGALVRLKTNENTNNSINFSSNSYDGPQTTTDSEGRYTLEDVPEGEQTLVATRGVFISEINLEVQANATVEAPAAKLIPVAKLAYIPGEFDSMEDILKNELGLEIDVHIEEMAISDLFSAEILSQYAMIFINCGSDVFYDISEDTDFESLREFISSGGLLYMSDLEMPLLWLLFPDDFPYDEFYDGEEGTVQAEITFDPLADFLEKSSVDIVFDLGGWMGLKESSMSVQPDILIRGDYLSYDFDTDEDILIEDGPLAIFLPYGDGALIFTSFHNTGSATFDQRAVLQFYVFGFGGQQMQALSQPVALHHLPEAIQRSGFETNRDHRHSTETINKLSGMIQARNH